MVQDPVNFYTISSSLYFPGFVAMVNSLRLAAHHEPVTVLERGMSGRQKAALEGHCTVVSMPEYQVRNPCHLTAYPSRLDTEGVVVFIDSDALVLGRLDEAIEGARDGKICMYGDPEHSRSFPEWEEIFDLQAPLRPQPYYNTGFVAFSVEAWPGLLERWWVTLRRIWDRPSFMEGAALVLDPTSQPDQDAFNAILMSEIPEGAVHELPAIENAFPGAPPPVVISDLESMSCTRGGEKVLVIQSSGSPKPWTWASLPQRRQSGSFLPLLRRALAGEGLEVRVPPRLVPPWLRPGQVGSLAYTGVKGWLRAPGPRRALRYAVRKMGGLFP